MPIEVTGATLPTVISKPDQRYAATFLSTKYRKYAVNAEFLKDDSSGEIFFKRKADGHVLSFFQNKKYMYDVALELRVLLSTNPEFVWPSEDSTAFFLSTNYDLAAINKEELLNAYSDDITIATDGDSLYQFHFNLSKQTNGFFMEVNTRDVDKPLVEILTNYYDQYVTNYDGSDDAFISERSKMDDTVWQNSNCTVSYVLTIVDNEGTSTDYNGVAYTRINEHRLINIYDLDIDSLYPDGYASAHVQITNIQFQKIHFILEHAEEIGSDLTDLIDMYTYEEGRLEIHNVNIMHFVDNPEDYIDLGNNFIVAFADVPYILLYMSKMMSLIDGGCFIVAEKRPLAIDWPVNGVWAEIIRYIDKQGNVTDSNSENSKLIDQLEDILGPNRIRHGIIATKDLSDAFWLTDLEEFEMYYEDTSSTEEMPIK